VGNEAIELHDSTLEEIRLVGADAVLVMNVYVHSSAGRPGFDKGVGWYQDATVTIIRADVRERPRGNTLEVYDGSVRIGEETFRNVLPLPCNVDSPVDLVLAGTEGSLAIAGAGMRVVFTGQPGEIEDFRS
jgi:hypothetical protein